MSSNGTWILLSERPPPVSKPDARRKCWCYFATDSGREELGYYMGNGAVHIAGTKGQLQMRFTLDQYTHWQPLSENRLQEFDRA